MTANNSSLKFAFDCLMKRNARIFAYIWMVLILNTMFQTCFKASADGVQDPVNSISELVLEHWLGLEDGISSDEHGDAAKKLKNGFQLHWHMPTEAAHALAHTIENKHFNHSKSAFIYLNFSGDVLIPPPDGNCLAT